MNVMYLQLAGMPSLSLNAPYVERMQAVSFFSVVIVVSSVLVLLGWNLFAGTSQTLKKLKYGEALFLTVLWGLASVVVLTMISGARELMTPGAWQRNGLTHKLKASEVAPTDDKLAERRARIEQLQLLLMQYALTHEGQFPETLESSGFDPSVWRLRAEPEVDYDYFGHQKFQQSPIPIISEKPTNEQVLIILANGSILEMEKSNAEKYLKAAVGLEGAR